MPPLALAVPRSAEDRLAPIESLFAESAAARLSRPSRRALARLDPGELVRKADETLRLLASGELPALLLRFRHERLPGADASWSEVLQRLRDRLAAAAEAPGAKVPRRTVPPGRGIPENVKIGQQLVARVRAICLNPSLTPEERRARHDRIFAPRRTGATLPRVSITLRTLIAGIEFWGEEAPAALQLMLPLLREAFANLWETISAKRGRKPRVDWSWAEDVRRSAAVLEAALGAFEELRIAIAPQKAAQVEVPLAPPAPPTEEREAPAARHRVERAAPRRTVLRTGNLSAHGPEPRRWRRWRPPAGEGGPGRVGPSGGSRDGLGPALVLPSVVLVDLLSLRDGGWLRLLSPRDERTSPEPR